MNNKEKIRLFEKLLDKSSDANTSSSSDAKFKAWKNLVERTLLNVFGSNSPEMKQFNGLRFFYRASMMVMGNDYSAQHRQIFSRDFEILLSSIRQYIEEFNEHEDVSNNLFLDSSSEISKVFISHASKDSDIVEEVIELLEAIGLNSNQIFCSSFEGYGIGLGENFLDTIKEELSSESLVLFILTKEFYNSPVCLCEMGATWVLSKEHIPIIVSPLDFEDMKGVIPLSQGFKINEAMKLNLFKEKIGFPPKAGQPARLAQQILVS